MMDRGNLITLTTKKGQNRKLSNVNVNVNVNVIAIKDESYWTLLSRLRTRALTGLTRQSTPSTENGHALQ